MTTLAAKPLNERLCNVDPERIMFWKLPMTSKTLAPKPTYRPDTGLLLQKTAPARPQPVAKPAPVRRGRRPVEDGPQLELGFDEPGPAGISR